MRADFGRAYGTKEQQVKAEEEARALAAEAGAFIGALLAGLLASAWRSAVHRS